MRKAILTFIAFALVASLSLGAGLPAAAAAEELPKGPVSITFWVHRLPHMDIYFKEMIAEYHKMRPNIRVKLETWPTTELYPKLLVAMTTGTGPDVFSIGDWYMETYQSKGLLAPLSPKLLGFKSLENLKGLVIPGTIDRFIYDGKLYGWPMYAYTYSVFVNKKHFREAGLDPVKDCPKTWDDLVEVAKKLTKRDAKGNIIQQGLGMPYFASFWTMIEMSYLVRQFGGDILDEEGKAVVNSPAGVKALQLWVDFVHKHKVNDPSLSVASGLLPTEDFVQEKVSMWASAPWAIGAVKANERLYGDYSACPLPQANPAKPVNTLYGFAWVVNASASPEKQAAATDWIGFATSERWQEPWWERIAVLQILKSFYEKPKIRDFPLMSIFRSDMATGKWMARSPHFAEIGAAMHRAMQRSVLNKVDVKESLDQAAVEINRALGK